MPSTATSSSKFLLKERAWINASVASPSEGGASRTGARQPVVEGRARIAGDEERDDADAEVTAGLPDCSNDVVALSSVVIADRAAERMRDGHGSVGNLDRVQSRGLSTVREVDEDPDLV